MLNEYHIAKPETIRQERSLFAKYRIAGTIKLPIAAIVYNIPRQDAPRFPIPYSIVICLPKKGTTKFLNVLIPTIIKMKNIHTKIDKRETNAQPHNIALVLA